MSKASAASWQWPLGIASTTAAQTKGAEKKGASASGADQWALRAGMLIGQFLVYSLKMHYSISSERLLEATH